MLVIGLTGGIGSGKTTVAQLFSNHGIPIIDADEIARELTQPNQPAYQEIIKHFNDQNILNEDLTLNRSKLRQIIFKQTNQRLWLEKLLHPKIELRIKQRITQLTGPYCIAVIPLLFEIRPYSFIDRTLVVDASINSQIKRIKLRDHVDQAQIQAILATQTDREHRLNQAHDIITNHGLIGELEEQVNKMHAIYLQIAANKQSDITKT